MEINVGDYVRTKCGIAKLNRIDNGYQYFLDSDIYDEDTLENTCVTYIEYITKHSKDIIDLIEVGDIIEFKEDNDLYRVNCIPNEECGCNCFYLEFNYAEKYGVEDIMVDKEYMKTHLKSVLIKEQFEANAYTIEKER